MPELLCLLCFDAFHPKFTNDCRPLFEPPSKASKQGKAVHTEGIILGSERLRVAEFWYLAFRKLLKHLPNPAENVLLKETKHINVGPVLC